MFIRKSKKQQKIRKKDRKTRKKRNKRSKSIKTRRLKKCLRGGSSRSASPTPPKEAQARFKAAAETAAEAATKALPIPSDTDYYSDDYRTKLIERLRLITERMAGDAGNIFLMSYRTIIGIFSKFLYQTDDGADARYKSEVEQFVTEEVARAKAKAKGKTLNAEQIDTFAREARHAKIERDTVTEFYEAIRLLLDKINPTSQGALNPELSEAYIAAHAILSADTGFRIVRGTPPPSPNSSPPPDGNDDFDYYSARGSFGALARRKSSVLADINTKLERVSQGPSNDFQGALYDLYNILFEDLFILILFPIDRASPPNWSDWCKKPSADVKHLHLPYNKFRDFLIKIVIVLIYAIKIRVEFESTISVPYLKFSGTADLPIGPGPYPPKSPHFKMVIPGSSTQTSDIDAILEYVGEHVTVKRVVITSPADINFKFLRMFRMYRCEEVGHRDITPAELFDTNIYTHPFYVPQTSLKERVIEAQFLQYETDTWVFNSMSDLSEKRKEYYCAFLQLCDPHLKMPTESFDYEKLFSVSGPISDIEFCVGKKTPLHEDACLHPHSSQTNKCKHGEEAKRTKALANETAIYDLLKRGITTGNLKDYTDMMRIALWIADETYHTFSAFIHVVLLLQLKAESIYLKFIAVPDNFIDMLFISALENFHFCFHYKDYTEFVRKTAKYIARISNALKIIDIMSGYLTNRATIRTNGQTNRLHPFPDVGDFLSKGQYNEIIERYKNSDITTSVSSAETGIPKTIGIIERSSPEDILKSLYDEIEDAREKTSFKTSAEYPSFLTL